jgi:hypothetical protein
MKAESLEKVKAAIAQLREATCAEAGLFSNQEEGDGSHLVLGFDHGKYYLNIHSGELFGSYSHPQVGLSISGYIYNPRTELAEALTLHHFGHREVNLDINLDDESVDYVELVTKGLMPKVHAAVDSVRARWGREARREAALASAKLRFGIAAGDKKIKTIGDYCVEIQVWNEGPTTESVAVGLNLRGLSPGKADAILALLKEDIPESA